MKQQQSSPTRVTLAVIAACAVCAATTGDCQEIALPEPTPARSDHDSIFGVGGSARKALPPLDCLRCTGPAACVPCDRHHRGFLYYGSCPWDDDCVNGFDDCVDRDCGHIAAALTRAWIRLHEYCWRPRPHSRTGDCDGCGN